ncbi:MAG: DUF6056 family protein [Chloroflexota bacterium]|nr:DUF6056 family protein [Chloroflexota bacterium]
MKLATSPHRVRVAEGEAGRPRGWLDAARSRPDQLSLAVLSLSLLASLCAYAYRGWFSRYTADDYCTAGLQRALGFVGAQVYWYEFWSGRMTYYFVVGLVEYAGSRIVQVLPAIAIAAWVCVGAWALLPVARSQRWPAPTASAVVGSAAIVLVCLSGAPRLDQSVYWMTGMLTYLLPVVLMTAYAGWLTRRTLARMSRPASRVEMLVSGAYLLLVGGLSEVSLAVQLGLLGLATWWALVLLRSARYQALRMLLVGGLIASVISAVIVVAAPGNYVHEATVSGRVHAPSELPLALRASVDFVGLFARAVEFRARPAVVLLLMLVLAWGFFARFANGAPHAARRWYWYVASMAATLACGWLVLIAASVPGYFAQQWDVPERAQFVGVWIVAITTAITGYLVGHAAGETARRLGLPNREAVWRRVWCAALLVAAAAPVPAARDTLALIPADAAYAAEWDSLDATLRADASAGGPAVLDRTLPPHFGFEFLGSDPTIYPNPCVSRFYGLPSIRVSQAE